MNDLAEFLLERIAEDEGLARVQVETRDNPYLGESYWRDKPWLHADPDRILVECDARRRIVTAAVLAAEQCERGTRWERVHMLGMANGLNISLRYLSALYADHPDYRSEWNPPSAKDKQFPCLICGKSFTRSSGAQKLCSAECRAERRRIAAADARRRAAQGSVSPPRVCR